MVAAIDNNCSVRIDIHWNCTHRPFSFGDSISMIQAMGVALFAAVILISSNCYPVKWLL